MLEFDCALHVFSFNHASLLIGVMHAVLSQACDLIGHSFRVVTLPGLASSGALALSLALSWPRRLKRLRLQAVFASFSEVRFPWCGV